MKWFYFFMLMTSLVGCANKNTTDEKRKMPESTVATLIEAYEFGYPLVLMDVTREISTNVAEPDPVSGRAPMNQFVHLKNFPTAASKDVVRPNVDTMYSLAWLDLSHEPQVIDLPDTNDRYYLMPMLDAWTNVYRSPGKRTTGTTAKKYIIVGPNWKKKISSELEVIHSPTNMTWILGRTQANSLKDAQTVVAKIQSGYKIYPLSSLGKTYFPPKSKANVSLSGEIPVEKVAAMSTDDFFNRLNRLMVSNPPAEKDKPALEKFKKLGIAPGATFDSSKLPASDQMAIARLPKTMDENFKQEKLRMGNISNGWMMIRNTGSYGTRYHQRAIVAYGGLGANLDADAIYPNAIMDKNGEKLTGKKIYRIHFEKNELPPANAFWSLTVYGADNFLVKNPINRYALGDRDKLKYNADGSLDIYLSHRLPRKDLESNWLPTPDAEGFEVTARLYWPKEKALEENWTMPPLEPITFQNLSVND